MKVSLSQQLEEIAHELDMRRQHYPRMVRAGKLMEAEAEFRIARMEAVKATLEWLQKNEAIIRNKSVEEMHEEGSTGKA